METTEVVIDWPTLVGRIGGCDDEEEFITKIIEAWSEGCPSSIFALAQAIETADVKQIRIMAHTIKGAAATICAESLADAAFQIETAGIEGNLENVPAMFTEMQEEFEKVRTFLSQSNWIQIAKEQVA